MNNAKIYDVVIVGGSAAGLSAALTLGRSIQKVLVIDNEDPCNKPTPHSQNFLTQDGKKPSEIIEQAKRDVKKYNTVSFSIDLVTKVEKSNFGFSVATQKGKEYKVKRVIFATGVKDLLPNIKGFKDCWGKTIIHCPYCHGYEHKSVKTALIANGAHAMHMLPLLKNLSDEVTLITNGNKGNDELDVETLEKNKINIIDKEIKEIIHQNGNIEQIVFTDKSIEKFNVAYAIVPFEQKCSLIRDLGCELTETGHVKVNPFHQTNIDGVFACGDSTNQFRSIAYAVATGNIAGAFVNKTLADEDFINS